MLRSSPTTPLDPNVSASSLCSTTSSTTGLSTQSSNNAVTNMNGNMLLSYYRDLMENDSVDSLPQKRVIAQDNDQAITKNNLPLDLTFNESMEISTSSIENQTPNTSSSAVVVETPQFLRTSDFSNKNVLSSSSNDLSPLQFIDSPGRSKYRSGIDSSIEINSTNENPFRPVSPLPNNFSKSIQSNFIDSFIHHENNKDKNISTNVINNDLPDNIFQQADISSKISFVNKSKNNLSVFTNINPSSQNFSSVSVPSSPTTPISPITSKPPNNSHSNNLRKFLFKKASFSKLLPSSSQQIPSPTSNSFSNSAISLVNSSNVSTNSNSNLPDSYPPTHAHSQSVMSAGSSENLMNDSNSTISNATTANSSNGISRLRNVRSLPQLRRLNIMANLPNTPSNNNNIANEFAQTKVNSNSMNKENQYNNFINRTNKDNKKPELPQKESADSKSHSIETKEFIDYTTFAKYTAVSCNKTSTTGNLNKSNKIVSQKPSTSPLPKNTFDSHINTTKDSQNTNDTDLSDSSSSIGSSSVISLDIQHQASSPNVDPVSQALSQSASTSAYTNHLPPKSAGSSIALSITSSNNFNSKNNEGHQSNNNSISSSGKISIGGNSGINHAPSFARRLVKKASSSSLMRHITSSGSSSQYTNMNNNGNKKPPPALQLCTSESMSSTEKPVLNSQGFSMSSSTNYTITADSSNMESGTISSPVISVSGLRTPIDGSFSKVITPAIPINKNVGGTKNFSISQNKHLFSEKNKQKQNAFGAIDIDESEVGGEVKENNESIDSEASSIYDGDTDFDGENESNSDTESLESKGDLIYESDTSKELDKIDRELKNAISQQKAENSAFEVTKARLEGSGWYTKEQLDDMSRRQNMVNQMWAKKISALQERYQMLLVLQEQQNTSRPVVQRKSERKKSSSKKKVVKKKSISKKGRKSSEKDENTIETSNEHKDKSPPAPIISQQNDNGETIIGNGTKSTSRTASIISEDMILDFYNNNSNTNISENGQVNDKPVSSTVVNLGTKISNQILLADEDEEDLILRSRSATLVSSRTAHTNHSNSIHQYSSINNAGKSFDEKSESNAVEFVNANAAQSSDEIKNGKNLIHEEDYVDPSERFEFEMS